MSLQQIVETMKEEVSFISELDNQLLLEVADRMRTQCEFTGQECNREFIKGYTLEVYFDGMY